MQTGKENKGSPPPPRGYSPVKAILGRAAGYGMVFGPSALNKVYNFKRVCPGPILDRVWLQDCRPVFGNPKKEMFVCIYFSEQCFTSIKFAPKVHPKFWDFSPSLLGNVLFCLF